MKILGINKFFIVTASLVVVFFLPKLALAATYYVDSVSGSNTNNGFTGCPGSSCAAWQTLSKVNSTATTGDTVLFKKGGTWTEILTPGNSGITYDAYGTGSKPVITGSYSRAYGINITNRSNISISNIEVRDASTTVNIVGTSTGVSLNNVDVLGSVMYGVLINNSATAVMNNVAFGAIPTQNLLYVKSTGDVTVVSSSFTGPTSNYPVAIISTGNFILRDSTFATSLGNAIYIINHSGPGGVTLSGNTINVGSGGSRYVYVGSGTNTNTPVIITGNIFNLMGASTPVTFSGPAHDVTISNNIVNDTSTGGPSRNLFDIKNQNNVTVSNNTITITEPHLTTIEDIYLHSTGTSFGVVRVTGNTIYDHGFAGHAIRYGEETYGVTNAYKLEAPGSTISNNTIYSGSYWDQVTYNGTHAIFVGWQRSIPIQRNYVNGAGYGVVIKGDGSGVGDDWNGQGAVAYNTFVNNFAVANVHIKGVKNVPVYNNVMYNTSPIGSGGSYYTISFNGQDATGNILKNNIVYVKGGSTNSRLNLNNTTVASNNDYYSTTGALDFQYNATHYSTLPTWATAGFENSVLSKATDPMWISTTNFLPQANSPMIDAGVSISGLSTDSVGKPIYGAPDIGAYEYQPPFTIGANLVDATGNIRIYGDGKYRYTTATSSSMSADFSVAPAEGSWSYIPTDARPEWLNISNFTWNTSGTYSKKWTASSLIATTTVYTIGNLVPNNYYAVAVDGTASTTLQANAAGRITYPYSGGYAASHLFTVTYAPDTTAPGVSLTSPTDTSTVSGSVTLSATATDDTGVTGVQFKLDGTTNIGPEITVAPYTTTWDSTSVASGSHTISAVARDAAGNTSISTVGVGVDNVAPTIISVVRDSNTQITVTLSKSANPLTITKADDSGFLVTQATASTTYSVLSVAPGADNSKVVLTTSDMLSAGGLGVVVSYTSGGNGVIADIAGNLLATSGGTVVPPWDTTAPIIASVTSSVPDGVYTTGAAIGIEFLFSKEVTSSGSVMAALNNGGSCSFAVARLSYQMQLG